ncbi:ISL3 family transposase [Actinoplanes regularis]|uniref:ISL3 family transposase n=1 Tax=Actinoplanes regularis TaxID=52697 RepID=UPI0024A55097|nr:ISL3 family transposase [Actinoplanes regularis]GLW36056.1 ISL3 family transposase [Actinoplanes regularis]
MNDVDALVSTVFAGLVPLSIDEVVDQGELILIRARTPQGLVACPDCGALTQRVHGYHVRTVADVSVDARRVVLRVRVRRLVCPTRGCRQTFREQVPGVLERYQRRTSRLTGQIGVVVKELAGRAGARLLSALKILASRHTTLRILLGLPPPQQPVPRVLGVDDFALRRSRQYATILINAETHARVDVLPDRKTETLETWLRTHPGVQIVCRDSSASYAEAIRRALPAAIQVADRWHLWHNLGEAAGKEVAAHSRCWAKTGPPLRDGPRAMTTRERWQQVHALTDKGVGLLACARRLNLSLNTVKRYARAAEPDRLVRAPKYRPTLVDPYRDHLRQRREQNPATPILHLFQEIKNLGYTGSLNLLHKYINQGRVEADRPAVSPRRLTSYLLTHPDHRTQHQQDTFGPLATACPEMTALGNLIHAFAALLDPADGNADQLTHWINTTREEDLPHLHAFTRGLDRDRNAVDAALTLPHHNGTTEGVNTKTKLLKRQMYGRAGFPLLRHRILLG